HRINHHHVYLIDELGERSGSSLFRQGQAARGNRGRLHNGGRRLSVGEELVKKLVQHIQAFEVDFHNEAVFAGYAVAFGYLGESLGKRCNLGQLAWHGPYPHEGGYGESQRSRVELHTVAANDTCFLQLQYTLANGRGGHFDPPRQLGDRDPWVVAHQSQKSEIACVMKHLVTRKAHD